MAVVVNRLWSEVSGDGGLRERGKGRGGRVKYARICLRRLTILGSRNRVLTQWSRQSQANMGVEARKRRFSHKNARKIQAFVGDV